MLATPGILSFFRGQNLRLRGLEQLGFESPDSVILPVGNGTLLLGLTRIQRASGSRTDPEVPKISGPAAIAPLSIPPLRRAGGYPGNSDPETWPKESHCSAGSGAANPRGGEKGRGDFLPWRS